MELLKLDERPAEFKWKDVTFTIRTNMTVGDKFEIDTFGEWRGDGSVKFSPWPYYVKLIQMFVTSWKGVVDGDKKEVPWSFGIFMNSLPADRNDNIVLLLGAFIAKSIGVIQTETSPGEGAKKD